jgi:hypothetical protein
VIGVKNKLGAEFIEIMSQEDYDLQKLEANGNVEILDFLELGLVIYLATTELEKLRQMIS